VYKTQEITISNANNAQISSQTPEMVETTSGSLANQGSWGQMTEIIKFSVPATGIWICGPLMSLIDTAVIGQGSSLELAALGTPFERTISSYQPKVEADA